jgi:hypothetical protein
MQLAKVERPPRMNGPAKKNVRMFERLLSASTAKYIEPSRRSSVIRGMRIPVMMWSRLEVHVLNIVRPKMMQS